jgi:hypothetical protein
MTEWKGLQEVTGFTGGQHGGMVVLGDALVPPKASMTFEGRDGTPDATLRFEIRDGRPECVEVHVMAGPDGRGIRSADLAMVNVDTVTIAVFAQLAEIGLQSEAERLSAFRSVSEARLRRRPTVTRTDLEEVAKVYRKHLKSDPTAAVARQLGYTHRTAARRVAQAREAGLLPATTPGKRKA